ncbi:MAG: 50S ribosomal protein L25 [Chlamydiales bacterium]|nr:50S ribosomal protein L25 [Chlamydiales bacterium]
MKLTVSKRSGSSKQELSQIRRAGNVPAVLYSKGEVGQAIEVNGAEFRAILRNIKKGCLSTTVFLLKGDGAHQHRAILKDIQYEPTTYDVWHLDFEELFDTVPVTINVPIQCVGVVDCVGIKLGGVLRQVIRTLKVSCLPKDIPSEFQLDIKELLLFQTKRLADIALPSGMRPVANMNEVAVVIAKR